MPYVRLPMQGEIIVNEWSFLFGTTNYSNNDTNFREQKIKCIYIRNQGRINLCLRLWYVSRRNAINIICKGPPVGNQQSHFLYKNINNFTTIYSPCLNYTFLSKKTFINTFFFFPPHSDSTTTLKFINYLHLSHNFFFFFIVISRVND